MHPLGRMGAPEDVALAALFLVYESSSWITGVTVDVAGGRIIVWGGEGAGVYLSTSGRRNKQNSSNPPLC